MKSEQCSCSGGRAEVRVRNVGAPEDRFIRYYAGEVMGRFFSRLGHRALDGWRGRDTHAPSQDEMETHTGETRMSTPPAKMEMSMPPAKTRITILEGEKLLSQKKLC